MFINLSFIDMPCNSLESRKGEKDKVLNNKQVSPCYKRLEVTEINM